MEQGTKNVIKCIAEIQVDAIESIVYSGYKVNHKLLCEYLQITTSEIRNAANLLLSMYKNITADPRSFVFLPEYQVGVCAHILFEMEEIWVNKYGFEAVHGAWEVIGKLNREYHPEYSLVNISKYK